MRKLPVPAGGWLLFGAMAAAVLLSSAKPLAKKVGKGLKDIGERMMDESSTPPPAAEEAAQHPIEDPPKPARKPRSKPKPS